MTRTKIFLYFLLLLAFMVLPACQQEQRTAPVDQDGERVTVSLSVDVPHYAPMRAMQEGIDENKIDRLELLVFNEEGLMADYALATDLTKAGEGNYTFTARLKPQSSPCVIHFVANRNYGGSDSGRQYLGRKESDVLLSDLVTMTEVSQKMSIPMWARCKYNEVQENSNLGEIKLLRSMAKFTLESHTGKLADVSYTLCNSYNCGTVAPFKRAALPDLDEAFSVDNRVPTIPRESFLANGDAGLGWYTGGTPVYGFERRNKVAKPISCLVIRAKYDGATDYSYYKLDFVKSANRLERYDLLRNYWYKVTINDALAIGAPSLDEALAGPAVNNLALSEELQAYPSYSDGKGRLEVEASNYIITHGEQTLTFKANYYPEGSATAQNDKLQIVAVRNATDYNAIKGKGDVSIDNTTGQITATLQPALIETSRISDIIVGVTGDPDLMRIVRVEVRKPYNYELFQVNGQPAVGNAVTADVHGQKGALSFVITLPEDFKAQQLPMRLRFFTEHFYPDVTTEDVSMGKFSFGLAKDGANPVGRPCYTTIITKLPTDRTLRCTFLSNKSDCSETIEVVSVENLFDTQRVIVKAN
ncbi:fimbrial protein [Porphyromonas vaginalis]|uniref:fimbrial protein n=1 Tax=Porphyromonas vaginalis TaxID=3044325 RepID=UPI0026201866|nr:fimbrial protein [Porphyromonas vaginalis]